MTQSLVVIYGPTAVGKTQFGLQLAKKLKGQIICADSRQIYQFLDIGTGKDLSLGSKFIALPKPSWIKLADAHWGYFLVDGVKIWMLDLIPPNKNFSAIDWSLIVSKLIKKISKQGSLPIIVGGSAFYIKTLIDGIDYFGIGPDWQLRKRLEKKSVEELQEYLKLLWPDKFEKMNFADKNNPRRLIRAIEIQKNSSKTQWKKFLEKDIKMVGIYLLAPISLIKKNIWLRVQKRIKQGLIKEIDKVLKMGFSWNDPGLNTLGYKEFKDFFEGKKTQREVIETWYQDEIDYAKRQLVWFKKDKRFQQLDITASKFKKDLERLVKEVKI